MKRLFALLLLTSTAQASHYRRPHVPRPENLCHMVTENTQNIGDDPADNTVKVDQTTFMNILHAVYNVYSPIMKAQGGNFQIVPAWTDDEVNAYATRTPAGRNWIVKIYGGLARHPDMTPDSLLLATCHEVGHQLGGAPYKPVGWKAAAEGEADYFATLKCMRTVLKQFNNGRIVSQMGPEVTPLIMARCRTMGPDTEQIAVCIRSTVAGIHLGLALTNVTNAERAAHNLPPFPTTSLATPDGSVAQVTLNADYPGLQCRVDTYAAGAVCPVPISVEIVPDNAVVGACVNPSVPVIVGQSLAFLPGARPACWYRN